MDVKAVVIMAKDHVADVFLGEDIRNVGLEEVEFDDSLGRWIVTIGFSRPWDTKNVLNVALGESRLGRSYKVLQIDDEARRVLSIKDRVLRDLD